jgi:hypothetical protein
VPNYVYGDACVSGDDKYVIAQFRADAPMEWVSELRAFLVKDELKYKYFLPERHRVQANKELWKRVNAGLRAAEITIVDPAMYETSVKSGLEARGAEFGYDFDLELLRELAGNAILEDSPLNAATYSEYDWLSDNTHYYGPKPNSFSPAAIKSRVGGKLKHAVLTAARAHAMVSPSERQELILMCSGASMPSPARQLRLIKRMARVFDTEHAQSVSVLNEFVSRIAHASHVQHTLKLNSDAPMVVEANSQSIAHLQGADMAAGWAVDILAFNHGDLRTVAKHFAWVSSNGVVIPDR